MQLKNDKFICEGCNQDEACCFTPDDVHLCKKCAKSNEIPKKKTKGAIGYSLDEMILFERMVIALADLNGCGACKIKFLDMSKEKNKRKIFEDGYDIKRCKRHCQKTGKEGKLK